MSTVPQSPAGGALAAEPLPPRLVWRCRRGLREMDLLLLGWLERHWGRAAGAERATFEALLEESDQDILAWVLGREPIPARYGGLIPALASRPSSPDAVPPPSPDA